jgi:hypothetical protein
MPGTNEGLFANEHGREMARESKHMVPWDAAKAEVNSAARGVQAADAAAD